MASKYAGTKTEQNLKDAFSGESQARNKYTYYASTAKKAGYEQMSALYLETADQERHARCVSSGAARHRCSEERTGQTRRVRIARWTDMYARMTRGAWEEASRNRRYA